MSKHVEKRVPLLSKVWILNFASTNDFDGLLWEPTVDVQQHAVPWCCIAFDWYVVAWESLLEPYIDQLGQRDPARGLGSLPLHFRRYLKNGRGHWLRAYILLQKSPVDSNVHFPRNREMSMTPRTHYSWPWIHQIIQIRTR